ncbi:ABC transporter substrate-binding protein [Microbacterium sp. ASV49]|uniref:Extracellular solute-binding protein n=1 Tax=Microbacterium candidum TaxID=3041922 RepID=A0ABT7MXP1_9MICO|nr:extracellular solute-binding protein [Microbacterium sp. ASV49]MDL9979213.1 extracellular solute-binding protein [Microbacterium sp. ASV49]
MKRKYTAAAAVTVVATLSLAACSGGSSDQPSATADNKPVTLTMSTWNLANSPEFKTLADGFHAAHPNVTIELKDYDAAQYATLLTADLAAGTAPDILTMKNVTDMVTFASGGQLQDVSDVKLQSGIKGAASYKLDGKQYAIPYRIDGNVIYYNKDLFKAAGVPDPDGSWTWDDYTAAAEKLKTGLKTAGSAALPAYLHGWNALVQNFATAQVPASALKGDFGYMKPYYEQALKMQDGGLQLPFATVTANKTTYQAEFGKQQAAMEIMGTWYVATLLQQQAQGAADKFAWGMAPVPQRTSKTAGTSNTPITYGDPTGFAINVKTDQAKTAAAKQFLAYAESQEAALTLAKIGITPALTDDAVVKVYFGQSGIPSDDLTKFAWAKQKIDPQNPPSPKTATLNTVLSAMHSAIMTGSESIDKAISDAEAQYKNQVG